MGRKIYGLFICHDWEYSSDYYRLCDLLDAEDGFRWVDLSVPQHDPLDADDRLEKSLRDQIRPAHAVLVVAGMETARSAWIKWELRFAARIGKPIIGILPRGAIQIPRVVQNQARELVGWNRASIVDSIRRNAPRQRREAST